MKNNLPFVVGAFLLLVGAVFTPDESVRASPLFYGFALCFAYGFWRMWKHK